MPALPFHLSTKLNEWTPYTLSYVAECGSPDSATSDGADMLMSVLSATVEAVEYLDVDEWSDLSEAMADRVHAIAGGAPDVYTHRLWSQFVDLAAYNEDVSDYVESTDDLNRVASVALYVIAERLVAAIIEDIADDLSEAVDAVKWNDTITRARVAGAAAGRNAADWWCQESMGGRSPGDASVTARQLLNGIADGDPGVMDALPSLDLSGQWADGPTEADVLSDVDLDADDLSPEETSDVLDAYRDGFDGAAVEHVESIARSVVAAAD